MNKRAVQNTDLQVFIFCELGYNRTWIAIFGQVPNDNSDPVVSFLRGLSPVVGKTDLQRIFLLIYCDGGVSFKNFVHQL